MGLITKTVEITLNNRNIKYYKELGYKLPIQKDRWARYRIPKGSKILVRVDDLTDGAHVDVEVSCDCPDCTTPINKPVKWQSYKKCVHEDGKYYCSKCGTKLFGKDKSDKTRLLKSISFAYWCIKNLPLRQAVEIISRWDEEKNGCDIREVSYSSLGFNKKGYWFKCLKHLEHESELKRIADFTHGHKNSLDCTACNSFAQWGYDNIDSDNFLEKYWDYEKNDKLGINPWEISYGSSSNNIWIKCQEKDYHESYETSCNRFINNVRCPYCNGKKVHKYDSLGWLHPQVLKIWSKRNKKSPYEYTPMSTEEVYWECLDGHKDYKRSIQSSNRYKFRCAECQYSKGEERISKYFMINNLSNIPQKEFDGLLGLGNGNLSYDFYLPQYNLLIEYQGLQHEKYVRGFHKSKKDFETQVEHDRRKKQYCIDNKINLLEIWYYDFDNIEEILNKELKIKDLKQAN